MIIGPFIDAADGFTPLTGLTITAADVKLSKDGNAFVSSTIASSASHQLDGWYQITLPLADTGIVGILVVSVKKAGSLPVFHEMSVVTGNTYKAFVVGSHFMDANTRFIDSAFPIVSGLSKLIDGDGFKDSIIKGVTLDTTSIAKVVSGVLDEVLSGHTTAGTAGKALLDAESGGKTLTNKTTLSGDGTTVTVYEDDGTTVFKTFTVDPNVSRTPL